MWKQLAILLACVAAPVWAQEWAQVEKQAQGQAVYFYGWGGNPQINDYMLWAGQQIKHNHDVELVHVKVGDISEALTLLLADKSAGRYHQGRVDLLWVNGENFAALKRAELLYGPFSESLPNFQLVDQSLPVDVDFSTPVEGLEAPWGVGQLVMMYDSEVTPDVPLSAKELLGYARLHPGRISYPQPPQFQGMAFLKQLLFELVDDPVQLELPVDQVNFEQVTRPLWEYLDQLHAVAWYKGRRFPQSDRHMMQLLDDRELHMAISFNPAEAAAAVNRGELVSTVSSHGFHSGALTNIHFLAIPYNSNAKEGAQVVINFLMSAKAQEHKGSLAVWGDPPVLKHEYLDVSPEAMAQFRSIPEPHFSWQSALASAWLTRYGYQ